MNYRFTFFILIASHGFGTAQPVNLVPNGSFEERIECIWNNSNVKDAPPWFNPGYHGNDLLLGGTPDIFHECAVVNDSPCPYPEDSFLGSFANGVPVNFLGCESPFHGSGYAGSFLFIPNFGDPSLDGYREYLAVRLVEPLQEGALYDVSMQLSLAERTTHAIWNVQVFFSEDSLLQPTTSYMPYEPQLNGTPGDYIDNYEGWHKISWEYTASGGEQFMYIGNFQPNSEIDTLRTLEGDTFWHYFPASYYYIDDVRVEQTVLSASATKNHQIRIYPNPCIDVLTVDGLTAPNALFEIRNFTGQTVMRINRTNNGIMKIDISHLCPGIYILSLQGQTELSQHKIVKR